MVTPANDALKEYRQKVLERKEKEKKKAEEEKKKKSSEKPTGILRSSRKQPERKAKETPKAPAKNAKKSAGGVSKANNTKAAINKRLQAGKVKLLKKTSDSEAKKKGRERMRKVAMETDTDEERESAKKKPTKKPAKKSKGAQEISWKEPVTDVFSSNEDEDDQMEEDYEEENDLNTTFNESPDDSDSGDDSDESEENPRDSPTSDSDEEEVRKKEKDKRQRSKKKQMPLSVMIPKALWPRGMTKEAIDMMDLVMLEKMQAHDLALRALEGSKDEKNPGKIVDETAPTMAEVFVDSAYHDFVSKFSGGHFLHFPLSPPTQWWKFVAVAYDEITPEFGHEERGVTGRIARSTWVSAHNRKVVPVMELLIFILKIVKYLQWIGELPYWSSQNVYSAKLKKQSTLRMEKNQLRITMNDNDSFVEVKTVQEAWEAMNNYRSAWNRLWPWDWTPVSV